MRTRRTSTSRFGAGRRESHDATDFYARFWAPVLSDEDRVHGPVDLAEPLQCRDARSMDLPDDCAALVVTSPPYFAGKEYEAALGQGHVPATYFDYLDLLRDVFGECRRVLEPGGRIAVNVANLGRRPYRSLSGDVARILQDDLGLLLRGEVIWTKAEGASGSCAWGSFCSAANPVLRDVTERVVIASKGRFDRARPPGQRAAEGLPHRSTVTTDEFMEATLDMWRIPPESARHVRHPAPFPVELPLRLIELYTYAGDLVLDPFLGSGTTAVAAARSGRRYAGYDTDRAYVDMARSRLTAEQERLRAEGPSASYRPAVDPPGADEDGDDVLARASPEGSEGKAAQAIAQGMVERAGFEIVRQSHKIPGLGLAVSLVAKDRLGKDWYFDVSGGFTTTQGGLARTDTLWRSLGWASVLAMNDISPVVLITAHLPRRRSAGDRALRAVGPGGLFDVVEMLADEDQRRLAEYAQGGRHHKPSLGFWSAPDLARARRPGQD